MHNSKLFIAIAVCLALSLLLSCSKKNTIVGKWQWKNGETSYYLENGTVISSAGWNGSWEIKDSILTIKTESRQIMIYQVQELSSDKIVLKDLTHCNIFIGNHIE